MPVAAPFTLGRYFAEAYFCEKLICTAVLPCFVTFENGALLALVFVCQSATELAAERAVPAKPFPQEVVGPPLAVYQDGRSQQRCETLLV